MTYTATNRDVFDDAKRRRYLDAVAAGMTLADAAATAGVHHNVPPRHARTDPAFAQALADAKAAGKKVRQENVPHDEYRYNCLQCRCDVCCTAATKGRAKRRAAAQPAEPDGQSGAVGQVHKIRPEPKSSTSFLLARAS
ncbi:hypothetical protein [Streptomyces sp. BE133]|uniref:hypothetical protein n=1 Tax=Streptomyces sp. BE133 TaxID=3002523 RepID=UPI002E77C302|nr:hypothetical protein [Streptomyces sp. BE133]MEE1812676.1 hypothetical protein [Streptomyces sp. BE133]